MRIWQHADPKHEPNLMRATLFAFLLGLVLHAQASEPKTLSVARGLANPWAVAFLPDGRFLITERVGRLRIVERDGRLGEPVAGLPAVDGGGQCGLLDVVLDPKFADNAWVYWSYAEAGDGGNGTAVARGKLQGNRLAEVQVIFRQLPKVSSQSHCGSRLTFARDGRLFVVLGDRFSRKDDAQTLTTISARWCASRPTARCRPTTPSCRPRGPGPRSGAWATATCKVPRCTRRRASFGPPNMGRKGGDELNVVLAGRNYGWPLLTYGRNYGLGTRIGEEGPESRLRAAAEALGASVGGAQRHGILDE